ncbi:MAG: glycosyltransferase [Acidobacteriota bacterium]
MSDFSTFSIIIPTYQRPDELMGCLEAVSKLDYPSNKFEVIVVDDGGELSDELFSTFHKKINLTILHQQNSGPAEARNLGARTAKNDFLAFTDDDCEPDADWLKSFSEQFNLTPGLLLGGRTVNALETNFFSAASQMLIDYLYEYASEANPNLTFFTSNNLALSRADYFSFGGFDKTFPLAAAEDRDFCCRWQENKRDILFLHKAVVRHFHNLGLKSFWRQHFNYGRGAHYFHLRRAERLEKTIKLEPLSFYFKMFIYPFYKTSLWCAKLISFLFFIAQCANVFGFLQARISYFRSSLKQEKKI